MKSLKNIILFVMPLCIYASSFTNPNSLFDMTPDDLMELTKQIENHVNGMSAEEKSAFYKQVAAEQEKMSKMNEQELMDYVQKVDRAYRGEAVDFEPAPLPAQFETPAPVVEEKITDIANEQPTYTAPVVEQKTVDSARTMLDEIVQRIDYVLVRADSVNNMAMRISRWGNQNKLNPWSGIKWDTNAWTNMRTAIQTFKQKLHKIKDNKYLSDFIEDKEFYNHLDQLRDQLQEYEPLFVISEGFGSEQLSKQSYRAFRKILNILQYSIYVYDFSKAVDALEQKYAPRAAQLKAEESKKTERALEEVKKPVRTSPTQVAGSSSSGYNSPTYYTEPYPPYYPSYSSGGSHGNDYSSSYGNYESPSSSYSHGGGSGRTSGTAAKKGQDAEQPTDKANKKETAPNKSPKKEAPAESKEGAEELKRVQSSLQSAEEAMTSLDEMPARINSAQAPVNGSDIRNANLAISRLKIAKNRVNALKSAEKDIKARIKYSNMLESQIADFNALGQALNSLLESKAFLAPEKQYAFFGGSAEDQAAALAASPQKAGQISETTDIRKLVKQIEELSKAVEALKS